MRTFFTVDVEQDCPPFRSSFRGIEHGLPKLVEILKQKKIPATFFVTGDVARRYPAVIRELVDAG
ncbi:MAG: polysaccharide deacetylase, partial [Nitrospirae bacterium]